MNYLSEEEQYKEHISLEEIGRIKDNRLREIRLKYWSLRHKAFLDEHDISDKDLESIYKRLWLEEKTAIEKYSGKSLSWDIRI